MRQSRVRFFGVTVAVTILLSAANAYAGHKFAWPGYVSRNADGSGYAYGSAAATRGSSDSNQEVRCAVTWSSASCTIWDAAGNALSCQTTDAAMMAAARTFTSDSGLQILVNASGTCTGIYVYNWSSFAPKTP